MAFLLFAAHLIAEVGLELLLEEQFSLTSLSTCPANTVLGSACQLSICAKERYPIDQAFLVPFVETFDHQTCQALCRKAMCQITYLGLAPTKTGAEG